MSFMPSLLALNPGMLSAGGAAPDADVTAWAAAVVTNGGTVSAGRVALVSTTVAAWKAASTWPLIDDAWMLVAENVPQALTSLKQRRLATAVAAPTFTIDRGYAFSASAYIDTLFIPGTHAVAMTATSMHVAAYERTNVGSNSYAGGCLNTSTQNLMIIPRSSGNYISLQLNSQASGPGGDTTITDSRGLTVGSRNGTLAADVLAYKNGVAVVPWQPGTLGSAGLTTTKFYIGARADNVNVAAGFRASTLGFVSVGAAISAGQQPGFYSTIQSHMAALGANV